MRKYQTPGHQIPRWYGVSWFDINLQQAVCYPLGINIIAACIYYLWQKAVYPGYIMNAQHAMEEVTRLKEENLRLIYDDQMKAPVMVMTYGEAVLVYPELKKHPDESECSETHPTES